MSPMRLLVISDTHGDLQALRMAFAAAQPDAVLHLGDCAGDLFCVIRDVLHDRPDFPFRAVCGNCDPPGAAPQELTVSFGGQTIFMLHGHTRGVKYTDAALRAEAARQNAGIVLCGHTHIPRIESFDGRLFVNPGSARRRLAADSRSATYVVLTIDASGAAARLISLPPL